MDKKKILILGSGGREHVFVWKLSQSKHKPELFIAPGNGGTGELATHVDLSPMDFEAIGNFCRDNNINILIPGSEEPLVNGISNYMHQRTDLNNLFVFGPTADVALLEGSKDYAKAFMVENNIPTASYKTFAADEYEAAVKYVDIQPGPYVLKADGLAAGKGVVITENRSEAKQILYQMMVEKQFGEACNKLVIEEFLEGIEYSVFAISDGVNFKVLPMAKDYKRIGEGDIGLNTGGMGAVSPVPFVSEQILNTVITQIIEPTFNGFKNRGQSFVGFVFFGLIQTQNGPKVIEYNVRMGDPETEVVFPRINNDFVEILEAIENKRLNDVEISFEPGFCTTVFAVSGGYPGNYNKDKEMQIPTPEDGIFFHAGTKKLADKMLTSGGRVIASTAFGEHLEIAIRKSYANLKDLHFDDMYFRTDIGQDLMKYTDGHSQQV